MTKNSHKKKVVDAEFLNKLADKIYNPKKGTFLHLCVGELQGSNKTASGRKQITHCALGELYFSMTGHHPQTDNMSDTDIMDECYKRSNFFTGEYLENLKIGLKKLNIPDNEIASIIDNHRLPKPQQEKADRFIDMLFNVVDINDCESDSRLRARKVAQHFRKLAKLLK